MQSHSHSQQSAAHATSGRIGLTRSADRNGLALRAILLSRLLRSQRK